MDRQEPGRAPLTPAELEARRKKNREKVADWRRRNRAVCPSCGELVAVLDHLTGYCSRCTKAGPDERATDADAAAAPRAQPRRPSVALVEYDPLDSCGHVVNGNGRWADQALARRAILRRAFRP
jgi:hypothetical protein